MSEASKRDCVGISTSAGPTEIALTVLTRLLLIVCLVLPAGANSAAQETPAPDALAMTVARLDAALFDAYNACDLNSLGGMVADDLEFFHDKDGLAVGKQAFIESTRKNICGKVRRELVPGTLEVYPLGDYGALEIGVHRFHHPGTDDEMGQGKFVIVWHRHGDAWTMDRTISYAHSPVPR